MSENDRPESDPIDRAYVEAETLLSDADARARRRAGVLAAVAPAQSAVSRNRPAKRRINWAPGGWLAAACVGGLSVFVATSLYRPALHQAQTTPTPTVGAPTPRAVAIPPAAPAALPLKTAEGTARWTTTATPAPRLEEAPPGSPSPRSTEPARQAFPAAPSAAPAPYIPAPPPAGAREPSAMASMAKAQDYVSGGAAADARDMASPGANEPSNLVVTAERRAAQKPGRGARLRDAAADGRLAEVEALLDQGESIDAPDADGDTALMRSILADRPAVAAVLRRHGASLDRKNHAGESARDMAKASEDTALKRALGLSP